MSGGIYLLQPNEELVKMEEEEYDSESLLQTLLVKYHDLLGGDQIDSDEPRRFLLVKRELGIPSQEKQYTAIVKMFSQDVFSLNFKRGFHTCKGGGR